MSASVVIADTGGANVASLRFAFERLGALTEVTADGATIASADRVVLPGVGAARHAMERLREAGLINLLKTLTQPVLGICLGMQLFYERSEEAETPTLEILPGTVRALKSEPGRPVPHMGWNELEGIRPDPLLKGIGNGAYAYFVHGFAVALSEHTLACSHYGLAFSAIVRRGNFWGTQFHPERSGRVGARLLENFLKV
jgi:imidazole glycerol-phosphate synthase subunit HisH